MATGGHWEAEETLNPSEDNSSSAKTGIVRDFGRSASTEGGGILAATTQIYKLWTQLHKLLFNIFTVWKLLSGTRKLSKWMLEDLFVKMWKS